MAISKTGGVVFDASEWEVLFGQLRKGLNKPSELLRAAFFTRGIRAIVEHFRDEKGPNGSWDKRSPKTDARYDEINKSGQDRRDILRRSKGKKLSDKIAYAYSRGDIVESATYNGIPRGSYKSSNKLLVLTGMLRKSLSLGSLKKQTEIQDREKIMVFSPVWYSGHHDEGDPSRRLPARPFMWLSDAEKDDINKIILGMATGQA